MYALSLAVFCVATLCFAYLGETLRINLVRLEKLKKQSNSA
jgi:hypothetical protein